LNEAADAAAEACGVTLKVHFKDFPWLVVPPPKSKSS
jgi:hypothetical protein